MKLIRVTCIHVESLEFSATLETERKENVYTCIIFSPFILLILLYGENAGDFQVLKIYKVTFA